MKSQGTLSGILQLAAIGFRLGFTGLWMIRLFRPVMVAFVIHDVLDALELDLIVGYIVAILKHELGMFASICHNVLLDIW